MKVINRRKTMAIMVILAFFSTIALASADFSYEVKTVRIEDVEVAQASTPEVDVPVSSSSTITPDAPGDFGEPITLPMDDGGFYRRGSRVFEFNSTWQFISYQAFINESSGVEVVLAPDTGVDIDITEYEVFFDVFHPSFEFPIFQTTFEFPFPLRVNFPAQEVGFYEINVGMVNIEQFVLDQGYSMNLTVNHFRPGEAQEGQNSELFQSDPYRIMLESQISLSQSGYIDLGASTVDFGELDGNDADLAKVVGYSVYGLLKSAEYVTAVGFADQAQIDEQLANYLNLAYAMFSFAETALAVPSGLFYYAPSFGTGTGDDYTALLADNAYMLMALGELAWYGGFVTQPLLLDFDPTILETQATDLANRITQMFEPGTGDYRHRVDIVDYAEDGNPLVYDNSDFTSSTPSDFVYLEENSILAEAYYWQGFGFGPFATEMDEIVDFIDTNLKITSMDGVTLGDGGLFARYFDTSDSSVSDLVDLRGNAAYISHINTYAKEFYSPNSIATTERGSLDYASLVADNMLRVFEDSVSNSLLLFSTMNTTDYSSSEKIITNLDNSLAMFSLNRLAVNWEIIDPPLNGESITRTWKARSINGINEMIQTFLDDQSNLLQASYDAQSKKFTLDDNALDTNLLAANMFSRSVISDMFPIQMNAITADDLIVGQTGQVSLELSQITTVGSWIWWDPFKPFSVDATITIEEFGYSEKVTVPLVGDDFSGASTKLISFVYDVAVRGDYNVQIDLSTEGVTLLSQTVELTALGEAFIEFSRQAFDVTDTTFTTDLSYFDETGAALSSLQVRGSLGSDFATSESTFGAKYIRTDRTDSSGTLEMTFNVQDLVEDGLLDLNSLYSQIPAPPFASIKLYLNVTNVASFDLTTSEHVVEIQIRLKTVSLRTSPANLQLTQGTTDSFSFSVTALDQDQAPIANARIEYVVPKIPSIANTVFTDADGEATITLRDSDLFSLSDLAILFNDLRNDNAEVNTTIRMVMTAENYPTKVLTRVISILPNDIVITANPVQPAIKEKNILQESLPPIEIEVATSDLFSRVINSLVHIEWNNTEWDSFVDLSDREEHVTPYTFSLDPSSLPAGAYTVLIVAVKDGITSTVAIEAIVDDAGLSLSQEQIVKPKVLGKTIIVEASTIEDVAFTAISVIGALALAWIGGVFAEFLKELIFTKECPHCGSPLGRRTKALVCKWCGNDLPWTKNTLNPEEDLPMEGASEPAMSETAPPTEADEGLAKDL